jgi:hypothetical protein
LQFCQSSSNEDEELAHKALGDEYSLQISTLGELVKNIINFPNIQQVTFTEIIQSKSKESICLLQWLTPEGFLKLFVLLGRNAQGVGTSSFATYVTNIEKLEMSVDEKKAILETIDHLYVVIDSVVGHFMV